MVELYENYGVFVPLVKEGYQEINTSDINRDNYDSFFNGILNIMRDGIEDPEVQALKIGVHLEDGEFIRLTIVDLWFNLIFWTFPIYLGEPVTVLYLIDTRTITKGSIKAYFNILIKKHITDQEFITLNNMIDDTIFKLKYINEFSMFLANTVNFRDTIDLMEKYPEFNKTVHADLTGIPIEDVKSYGMKLTNTQIEYIKNADHCLRDSFISGEAVSPKQYKEVAANIGTKPDGAGGIYPYIINTSFINGGVQDPISYTIDSAVGRTAQILQKMNVGVSGAFARLLETNNLDTFFNEDPDYSCDTKNFIKIFIKDQSWLSMYDKRFYRLRPNGIDYLLDKDRDTNLIGRTVYFRSPITCDSYMKGKGICRKCYGNLYYINRDINPGKLAAELISSIYTQILLSAKHLLEASVIEMKWTDEFYDFFEINLNTIALSEVANTSNMYMVLDSSKFESDDDDDSSDLIYNEYTSGFDIVYPDGRRVNIHTTEEDNIYLSEDLNKLLKTKKAVENEGEYTISFDNLKSLPVIFTVKIQNQELQRTLERSKHIINREKDTSSYDKDQIVSEFISANADGGIFLNAIHFETIISNQIRDADNILERPNMAIPDCRYRILTLNSSLTNSPSITVNLEFQRIGQALVSPLSAKKRKSSIFDMYFMENPQDFVTSNEMIEDKVIEDETKSNFVDGVYFIDKPPVEIEENYEG